jgi:hypothetical protein
VLGRQRWLAETKVNVTDSLSGMADLYDCDTAVVGDYKVVGKTRFAEYTEAMSEVYRTQVSLYGRGFRNAGLPVETVAIILVPRDGLLTKMHVWSEPFDESVADEAIGRHQRVAALLSGFDVQHHPDRFEWFEKSGPDCRYCPWYSPNPTGPLQCRGIEGSRH